MGLLLVMPHLALSTHRDQGPRRVGIEGATCHPPVIHAGRKSRRRCLSSRAFHYKPCPVRCQDFPPACADSIRFNTLFDANAGAGISPVPSAMPGQVTSVYKSVMQSIPATLQNVGRGTQWSPCEQSLEIRSIYSTEKSLDRAGKCYSSYTRPDAMHVVRQKCRSLHACRAHS